MGPVFEGLFPGVILGLIYNINHMTHSKVIEGNLTKGLPPELSWAGLRTSRAWCLQAIPLPDLKLQLWERGHLVERGLR